MFDLDYPGHYMRRIKNVSITIPCVVGPYTSVHCRLTLLSSKTRVDPRLMEPPRDCCHDDRWKHGYQMVPDDPRCVSMYGATKAIATSSGQNDSGMFELNFRDERYLPFEFFGAISRWRIELPLENNHFNMETLSDVILHLNFTAREGGEALRQAANQCAQRNLPGAGVRCFDIKHEFPSAWHSFTAKMTEHATNRQLPIRLSRDMFPYLKGNRKIGVKQLAILFEAEGAEPSTSHIAEFWVSKGKTLVKDDQCDHAVFSIPCIATTEWPRFFYGVLEADFKELDRVGTQELGAFKFPKNFGEVTNAYLFCAYCVVSP
jgi:hypothetical protein